MKIISLSLAITALLLQACASGPADDRDTALPWAKPASWENNGTFSLSSTKEHGALSP
ncbi:MAG: hypothetical protein LBB20_01675 [Puniceicoccales bacterium]|nr:hypothetical protein [Puniceicoccales bacterium]